MGAVEVEFVFSERAAHDLERFVHALSAFATGDAHGGELARDVSHACAEHHASVREVVENDEVLGEAHRVRERQQHHVLSDGHRGRARGDSTGHHERRRHVTVVDEVVFGDPHVIEAELVDELDLPQDARVHRGERKSGPGRIAEPVEHTDADGTAHSDLLGRSPGV